MEKIDFVITWVDNADAKWLEQKASYEKAELKNANDSNEARYRDWDVLVYWFRAIEQHAPWVNKIHFVTCGQVPSWLNIDNPKIHLVSHADILNKRNLPTFNSCAIEMGLPNIDGLSEKFVYFNDDMFLNKNVEPFDFFGKSGLPLDNLVLTPVAPNDDIAARINYNCTRIINRRFSFGNIEKKKLFSHKNGIKYLCENAILSQYGHLLGLRVNHQPTSLRLSLIKEIHNLEKEVISKTESSRFRNEFNVSQWLYQYWQLASGKFEPRNIRDYSYYDLGKDMERACMDITKGKSKMICLNDTTMVKNFKESKKQLLSTFNKKYPKKSSYEK